MESSFTLSPAEWASFLAKVETINDPKACWPWRGGHNGRYPQFALQSGVKVGAHRIIVWMVYGYLPDEALHECDTPMCMRPDHLIPGDRLMNVRDMMAKQRHWRGPTDAMNAALAESPERRARGAANSRARFTADQVLEVRRRALGGQSHGSLAKEYGVSRPAISAIVNRTTWKHI